MAYFFATKLFAKIFSFLCIFTMLFQSLGLDVFAKSAIKDISGDQKWIVVEGFELDAENTKDISLTTNTILQSFSKSTEIPFSFGESIFWLSLDATFFVSNEWSIRITLIGKEYWKDREYMVAEIYEGIINSNSFSVKDFCEESCILQSFFPQKINIEIVGEWIVNIHDIHIVEEQSKHNKKIQVNWWEKFSNNVANIFRSKKRSSDGLQAEKSINIRTEQKTKQDSYKVQQIKKYIQENDLEWTAWETPVSNLLYQEKKKLFSGWVMPLLQGFEYYQWGVFHLSSTKEKTIPEDLPWTNWEVNESRINITWIVSYPDELDRRDYHGKNWNTPIRNQRSCGSCWAFGATSAVAALVNTYFNTWINLNLAEQELVSCSSAGNCNGWLPWHALKYIKENGIVDEKCFAYEASDVACNTCENPTERVSIEWSPKVEIYNKSSFEIETSLKHLIANKWPLSAGIYSWGHAMGLVWYYTDQDWSTVWIFKNSWGSTWWKDNDGYAYVSFEHPGDMWFMNYLLAWVSTLKEYDTQCTDTDQDNYCYRWIWDDSSLCSASCTTDDNWNLIKDTDDWDDDKWQLIDLRISEYSLPSQIMAWESPTNIHATVAFRWANNQQISTKVKLYINWKVQDTQDVSLVDGEEKQVSFSWVPTVLKNVDIRIELVPIQEETPWYTADNNIQEKVWVYNYETFTITEDGSVFDCDTNENPTGEPINEIVWSHDWWEAAIKIMANNVVIRNCSFDGWWAAVYVQAEENTLENNIVINSFKTQIYTYGFLIGGNTNTISENVFEKMDDAVTVRWNNNVVSTNEISESSYAGIHIDNWSIWDVNNRIEDNIIVDSSTYWIIVRSAGNHIISNNISNLESDDAGIAIDWEHSKNNIIEYNSVSSLDDRLYVGISLEWWSSSNIVQKNSVDNYYQGIQIKCSSAISRNRKYCPNPSYNNIVKNNILNNNSVGIGLYEWTQDNIIEWNIFRNSSHASIVHGFTSNGNVTDNNTLFYNYIFDHNIDIDDDDSTSSAVEQSNLTVFNRWYSTGIFYTSKNGYGYWYWYKYWYVGNYRSDFEKNEWYKDYYVVPDEWNGVDYYPIHDATLARFALLTSAFRIKSGELINLDIVALTQEGYEAIYYTGNASFELEKRNTSSDSWEALNIEVYGIESSSILFEAMDMGKLKLTQWLWFQKAGKYKINLIDEDANIQWSTVIVVKDSDYYLNNFELNSLNSDIRTNDTVDVEITALDQSGNIYNNYEWLTHLSIINLDPEIQANCDANISCPYFLRTGIVNFDIGDEWHIVLKDLLTFYEHGEYSFEVFDLEEEVRAEIVLDVNKTGKYLDHFEISNSPELPFIDDNISVSLIARDQSGNTLTGFVGPITLQVTWLLIEDQVACQNTECPYQFDIDDDIVFETEHQWVLQLDNTLSFNKKWLYTLQAHSEEEKVNSYKEIEVKVIEDLLNSFKIDVVENKDDLDLNTPVSFTISALDVSWNVLTGYQGNTKFSVTKRNNQNSEALDNYCHRISCPYDLLETEYQFTKEDSWIRTIEDLISFTNVGNFTVTITDEEQNISTYIELIVDDWFVWFSIIPEPQTAEKDERINVTIKAIDISGNILTWFRGFVNLDITNLPEDEWLSCITESWWCPYEIFAKSYNFGEWEQGSITLIENIKFSRAWMFVLSVESRHRNISSTTEIFIDKTSLQSFGISLEPEKPNTNQETSLNISVIGPDEIIFTGYQWTVDISVGKDGFDLVCILGLDCPYELKQDQYTFLAEDKWEVSLEGIVTFLEPGTYEIEITDENYDISSKITVEIKEYHLDHFEFSSYPSTPYRNDPVDVAITAKNIDNSTITSYIGALDFNLLVKENDERIAVTSTQATLKQNNYAFILSNSGSVTLTDLVTFGALGSYKLEAKDAQENIISSLAFEVTENQLSHFVISYTPNAPQIGNTLDIQVRAVDANNQNIEGYIGAITLDLSTWNELEQTWKIIKSSDYQFQNGDKWDKGHKVFDQYVVLSTLGRYKISVSDTYLQKTSVTSFIIDAGPLVACRENADGAVYGDLSLFGDWYVGRMGTTKSFCMERPSDTKLPWESDIGKVWKDFEVATCTNNCTVYRVHCDSPYVKASVQNCAWGCENGACK